MRIHPPTLIILPLVLGVSVVSLLAAAGGKWETSQAGGTRFLSYSATVPMLGKPTPVNLAFHCDLTHTETERGTVGFDLYVHKIGALAPFDFDAFEGPDAPAAAKKLVQITITRKAKAPVSFNLQASGSTPSETNFCFGVADDSHLAVSDSKSVLRALTDDDVESLRITVTDFHNARLRLELVVPIAGKQAEIKTVLTGLK